MIWLLKCCSHANSQNKQLSPSLITLLEKLSHAQGSMPLHSEKTGIAGSDADAAVAKEHLQKLLDRESYEKYVDDELQHPASTTEQGVFSIRSAASKAITRNGSA